MTLTFIALIETLGTYTSVSINNRAALAASTNMLCTQISNSAPDLTVPVNDNILSTQKGYQFFSSAAVLTEQ